MPKHPRAKKTNNTALPLSKIAKKDTFDTSLLDDANDLDDVLALVDNWASDASVDSSSTASSPSPTVALITDQPYYNHQPSGPQQNPLNNSENWDSYYNDDFDDVLALINNWASDASVDSGQTVSSSFAIDTHTNGPQQNLPASEKAPFVAPPAAFSVNDLMKNIVDHLNPVMPEKTHVAMLLQNMTRLMTEKAVLVQPIANQRRDNNTKELIPLLQKRAEIDSELLILGYRFLTIALHQQALTCFNNVYASYHPTKLLHYHDIIQSLYELSLLQFPQDKKLALRLSESAYLLAIAVDNQTETSPYVALLLNKLAHMQLSNNAYYSAFENFKVSLSQHQAIFSALATPSTNNADPELLELYRSAKLYQTTFVRLDKLLHSPVAIAELTTYDIDVMVEREKLNVLKSAFQQLQQQTLPAIAPCVNRDSALRTYHPQPYQDIVISNFLELPRNTWAP